MARITGVGGTGYRWYLAAQVVSLAGTMMGYTALFWLALHVRDGGAVALAAIDAALCLPMLLFGRRAGIIVARRRAVRVMAATQALLAAASLAIGVPLLAGWMTIWYLVAVSFATGCVQCVDLPARQTFMLDLVGSDELRRGTSLFATVTGLARLAGPAVAGLVIAVSGETAVFFIDAVSFLGVIAVLGWLSGQARLAPAPTMPEPPAPGLSVPTPAATPPSAPELSGPAPAVTPPSAPGPVPTVPTVPTVPATPATQATPAARRFRWLFDLPGGVQAAAAMALLVGGFGLQFAVTNPLITARVFGLGSVGFGLFGTSMAAGGIAGSYYSSRRRDPSRLEFLAWALLFGVAECLAAVMPTAWAYGSALAVLGAASQLFAASATVYVQQTTPAGQRGLALSAYNAGFIGFVPVGAFVIAAIASAAGPRWALAGPGLAIAACAAVLIRGTAPRAGWTGQAAATTARSEDKQKSA